MGDSQDPGAQGSDVRALFQKARLGNSRYLTFAAEKLPEAPRSSDPVKKVEESVSPSIPVSHARRTLNSVVEVNSRLRMASVPPRRAVGSGTALAFASCTGGAGKTTLCATVARALSARSSNVLVADRCQDGIIPFYFSLERQSAGGLQTVYPSARRAGYPIILVAAPCDEQMDVSTAEWLQQLQADSSLTLLDLPTHTAAKPGMTMNGVGHLMIPLLPDIQSVASIGRAEALAGVLSNGKVSFLLNRYQDSRPLHREIRGHLEGLLGDKFAPVAISESEFVTEALSLGMTVLDHAPQSQVAQDIERLAAWLEESLTRANSGPGKVEIA